MLLRLIVLGVSSEEFRGADLDLEVRPVMLVPGELDVGKVAHEQGPARGENPGTVARVHVVKNTMISKVPCPVTRQLRAQPRRLRRS